MPVPRWEMRRYGIGRGYTLLLDIGCYHMDLGNIPYDICGSRASGT